MPKVSETSITKFRDKLLEWYKINGRKYPWRESKLSTYKIVIAEVLLQRTKADNVNKFYNRFISDFPSWNSITGASQIEIENYLKPLGLYKQRARRLKSLSLEMVRRKGRLPKNRKALELIPLIGQYIANAIELLIFEKPSPLIDVNMSRLLERYFGNRKLADIRYDPYLQGLAARIVNHESTKNINWAILDYAALVCTARNPSCKTCLFRSECRYLKELKILVN